MFRRLLQGTRVALAKWDEFHAYFRVQCRDASNMLVLTLVTWDFGPWFRRYYPSLNMCSLTDVGFTDAIVRVEGANQGCLAASEW